MKKLIFLVIVTCTMLSCSTDEPEDEKVFDTEKFPQKWELVKMTGTLVYSESTGKDMDWQENYTLNADGTFLKHGVYDGVSYNAAGTYTIVNYGSEKYFDLVHQSDSKIVVNCSGSQTESLRIVSEKKLLGSASACDWPGLEYKRVE